MTRGKDEVHTWEAAYLLEMARYEQRPHWHADAKWVAGLLFCFTFSFFLVSLDLVRCTTEDKAVRTLGTAMALACSPLGLDDETGLESQPASGQSLLQPIPGLEVQVQADEIAGLAPGDIRLLVFTRVAGPVYHQDRSQLENLAGTREMLDGLEESARLLAPFNSASHRLLRRVLFVLGAASLILLLLTAFFSRRFGRLGGPGLALCAASLPGALGAWIVYRIQPAPVPIDRSDVGSMAGYLSSHLLPPLAREFLQVHVYGLLAGLGLILLAALLRVIWSATQRRAKDRLPAQVYKR